TKDNSEIKGVEPKAPPAIKGAYVLPGSCLVYLKSSILTDVSKDREFAGNKETVATGQITLQIRQKADGNWAVECGPPKQAKDSYGNLKYYRADEFQGFDRTALDVPVWTAEDSANQLIFLRSEVKSIIGEALLNQVVNSKTVQESVTKALERNTTV